MVTKEKTQVMEGSKYDVQGGNMWNKYDVKLQMTGRFAASLPRTREDIKAMLEHRAPVKPPANYISLEQLEQEVVEKVGAVSSPSFVSEEEEEIQYGWATFCRDDQGLYYEGRCIRGHLKDCANQLQVFLKTKGLKAKVANKVYVETDKIYLDRMQPDGTELRYVQVMTRKGPRSAPKWIDYCEKPVLEFRLKVLDDGVIGRDILAAIFDYGSVHGLGQERSQGWGRYTWEMREVAEKTEAEE